MEKNQNYHLISVALPYNLNIVFGLLEERGSFQDTVKHGGFNNEELFLGNNSESKLINNVTFNEKEDDFDSEDYNNNLDGFDFTVLDRISELEPNTFMDEDLNYEFELEDDFDYSVLDKCENDSRTEMKFIKISDIYNSNIGSIVYIKCSVSSFGKLNLDNDNVGFWMTVHLISDENNDTLQCIFMNDFIKNLIDKEKLIKAIHQNSKESIDIMKAFYNNVIGMNGVFSLLIVECDFHQVIGFETINKDDI
jgi:hypothetical protein